MILIVGMLSLQLTKAAPISASAAEVATCFRMWVGFKIAPLWLNVGLVNFVAEEKMSAGSAACAGFAVIAGVAVDVKDHIRGSVLVDSGIWVGGAIVEELDDFLFSPHCGLVLFGGQCAQGHV